MDPKIFRSITRGDLYDPADRFLLEQKLGELRRILHLKEEDDLIPDDVDMSPVLPILIQMEQLIAAAISKMAMEPLIAHPLAKVIVVVNYVPTLFKVQELTRGYHPLVLTGNLSTEEKKQMVRSFQFDPNKKLLIALSGLQVIGLNLSDPMGDRPRFMFISPSFQCTQILSVMQWLKRPADFESIRFCFGQTGIIEAKTLYAIARRFYRPVDGSTLEFPFEFID